jgi:cytochrome c oxidase cbb3-type subunit III
LTYRKVAVAVLMLGCVRLGTGKADPQSQKTPRAAQKKMRGEESVDAGRLVFASQCAGCHGLDGVGTERAPNIATDAKVQQRTDAALQRTIRDGVAAAGMPAFSTLDDATAKSVVAYLRFLQGTRERASVQGNAQHGVDLFFGKARCGECHMVNGRGGFIASDLSGFGRTHSAGEIQTAIISPRAGKRGEITVVKTRSGQEFSGLVRNEDNFSLQLQTLDGTFHFFSKTDVEGIVRQRGALMPSDYASTLSAGEIDDVVSFVIWVGGPAAKKAKDEDREE